MEITTSQRVRRDFSASPSEGVALNATIEGERVTLTVAGSSGGGSQIALNLSDLPAFIQFAQAVHDSEVVEVA